MRTGKLTEAALKRSVLRQLDKDPSSVQLRCGADCSILPQKSGFSTVFTTVSAPPGYAHRPDVLVTAAVNNLAAGGAEPQAVLVHAVLPPSCEESELRAAMQKIAQEASHYGMQVLGGHTEVSPDVTRPLYQITGIGRAREASCRADTLLHPGDALVMTKWIALAGTAALAKRFEKELGERFPFPLIDRAKEFEKLISVAQEARAATHFGTCAMHDLSQGGVFGALWEMAERAGVGLEVDLKKIPVRQETIELCEYFDINPYNLYSAGALLIGTNCPEQLLAELSGCGVPAAVIGRATDGNDRILRNGEDVRFLDRPQQEEWYRRIEK